MTKNKKKDRVDRLLVERKLASSNKRAQALIYTGKVYTQDRKILNPSEELPSDAFLGIKKDTKETNFVSRGGDKLLSAIEALKLEKLLPGIVALDIGASTGGFTDCLLKQGAHTVLALDVGTNQLTWELRQNNQVISIEKTNITEFEKENFPEVDFVVADISFNSLAKLSKAISQVSSQKNLKLLLLVKPQFELPKEKVPKGGVVTNEKDREEAIHSVEKAFKDLGFFLSGKADSKTKGRTGNQETFLYFQRK